MFRFAEPEYFFLLIIIPVMVGGFWWYRRGARLREAAFADLSLFSRLAPERSPKRVLTKFILMLVAVALIATALAQPQLGAKLQKAEGKGSEIMLVVDVSRSMLTEDFKPSRLARTQNAIGRLIEKLSNDRVGMIVFAGRPYMQLPITADYVSAGAFVRSLSTDMVPEQGTSIESALDMALQSFSAPVEGRPMGRTIVLITDGESHDDTPLSAIERAKEAGITIHAVGIGTPEGMPIVIGGQTLKDSTGQIVVSRLDEATLQQLAVETGGAYVRATDQSVGLDEILKRIETQDKQRYEALVYSEYNDQFYYLVWLALGVLVAEGLMIARRNRILSKITIFATKDDEN